MHFRNCYHIRLELMGTEAFAIAPCLTKKMDGESYVANCGGGDPPRSFYRQGAVVRVCDIAGGTGTPPRLGRGGKLELTETLRSQDRS
jgi:hypothetical protein